jgi:hypothetical protein
MRCLIVGLSAFLMHSAVAFADDSDSLKLDPPVHTRDSASGTATDTGSLSHDLGNGYSVGGYSTTTTTGGYREGGSGQAIPDNTSDSTQNTTYGGFIRKDF